MGIRGLTPLILQHAPEAIKEHDSKTLFGREIAIDASMSIYQFLIAVRQRDGEVLQDKSGKTTSHLMGFFYRTILMVENGIKPCYVFNGKPPELESGVVKTVEEVDKFSRKQVRVTKEHNEESRKLLGLMGIPTVVAPFEAKAQCAELARGGKVYAVGSEDMDTLTFNAPVLIRNLTFSEKRKQPFLEVKLPAVLEGLEMDMGEFVELCILLGCDYLEPIKGIGPKLALKMLHEHGGLKQVVEHLREKQAEREEANAAAAAAAAEESGEDEGEDGGAAEGKRGADNPVEKGASHEGVKRDGEEEVKRKKVTKGKGQVTKGKVEEDAKGKEGVTVPESWPWERTKALFLQPDVTPADDFDLEWKAPDVEGLVEFLVRDKGFNEDRVRNAAAKLTEHLVAIQQGRVDGSPKSVPKMEDESSGQGGKDTEGAPAERKVSDEASGP